MPSVKDGIGDSAVAKFGDVTRFFATLTDFVEQKFVFGVGPRGLADGWAKTASV
jgi:hypothetical protein